MRRLGRDRRRSRRQVVIVIKLGVELLFEHQKLFSVDLLDGGQCVDVLLEFLPGDLRLGRMGQPVPEVLDQLVISHLTVVHQHVLPH